MIDKIKKLAKQYSTEFIAIRHHLHANPELSYQEFETSKFIQVKLKEFGIPHEVKALSRFFRSIDVLQPSIVHPLHEKYPSALFRLGLH